MPLFSLPCCAQQTVRLPNILENLLTLHAAPKIDPDPIRGQDLYRIHQLADHALVPLRDLRGAVVQNVHGVPDAPVDGGVAVLLLQKEGAFFLQRGHLIRDTLELLRVAQVVGAGGLPEQGLELLVQPIELPVNVRRAQVLAGQRDQYAECTRFCGISAKSDEEALKKLIEKIEELKKSVGVKACIKDYGVDEKYFLDTLDAMVEQAFDDQCTGANPRYPLMSEIKDLYLKAYYGK